MSARAAWRLEQLGFTEVYDYSAGRKDWQSMGLPITGTDERGPTVADAASHDPPTASTTDTVGSARKLTDGSQLIVANDTGVVVGVMRKESWDSADDDLVGDAMRLGPATVRPGSQLAPLIERMETRDVESVIVTDSEGRLVGVVTLETGKALLRGEIESTFETCDSCPGWWRYRVTASR